MSHAVPGLESFLSPTAVLPAPMSAPFPWARAAAGADSKITVRTRSRKRRLLIIARRDISSWPRGFSGRTDQVPVYQAVAAAPTGRRAAGLMVVDRKVRAVTGAEIRMGGGAVPAGQGQGAVPAGQGQGAVPAGRGQAAVPAGRGQAAVPAGRGREAVLARQRPAARPSAALRSPTGR